MPVPQQNLNVEHKDLSFLKSKSDTKTYQKNLGVGMFTFRTSFAEKNLACGKARTTSLCQLGSWLQITDIDTGNLKGKGFMEVQWGAHRIHIKLEDLENRRNFHDWVAKNTARPPPRISLIRTPAIAVPGPIVTEHSLPPPTDHAFLHHPLNVQILGCEELIGHARELPFSRKFFPIDRISKC